MLSNLFIDTDIILDIVLDRKEFFENSSKIFQLFENGEALLYTSPSIIILFLKPILVLSKKLTNQNFQM